MALGTPCVAFGLPENRVTGADAAAYGGRGTAESLASVIARLLGRRAGARGAHERVGAQTLHPGPRVGTLRARAAPRVQPAAGEARVPPRPSRRARP